MNFFKSQLFGLNVEEAWLQHAAGFLNCKVGSLPFIYLSLPIGADATRKGMWQSVLDKIGARLAAWNSNHLSLAGKIILLKSVLYALPIFYLSFFKAPVGVVGAIETLFRRFLWGGLEGSRKIHWVTWSKICREK